jgi:nitric oxide reductase subunit C
MSTKSAKNLFIFGSLFFFVVLVILTVDTMGKLDQRAPEITEEVNAGKKIWHKYDCIGCHTILGNGSYFAPDMTKAAERKPKEYLKKFVLNPKAVNPKAAMPKLGLTEKEADELMAFLEWIARVDTNDWPPKPILAKAIAGRAASQGQVLFQQHECGECHQIMGIGGTAGPELTHVGRKITDVEWHIKHFKDPESVVPDSAMPSYDQLSDEELRELSEFLVTLK